MTDTCCMKFFLRILLSGNCECNFPLVFSNKLIALKLLHITASVDAILLDILGFQARQSDVGEKGVMWLGFRNGCLISYTDL